LEAVHARIRPMLAEQVRLWFAELHPALKRERISIKRYEDLSDAQKAHCDDLFRKQMFPILTPLAVDPGHPFPFISNLSKSMGVMIEHPPVPGEPLPERSFVRIKVPENLSRWIGLACEEGED